MIMQLLSHATLPSLDLSQPLGGLTSRSSITTMSYALVSLGKIGERRSVAPRERRQKGTRTWVG